MPVDSAAMLVIDFDKGNVDCASRYLVAHWTPILDVNAGAQAATASGSQRCQCQLAFPVQPCIPVHSFGESCKTGRGHSCTGSGTQADTPAAVPVSESVDHSG
jgi:hypothetical protein